MSKPEKKMDWKSVKMFEDGDLVVEVQAGYGFGRPKWSLRLGSKRQDGTIRAGIAVYLEGQGTLKLREDSAWLSQRVAPLITQALKFIEAAAQTAEDEFLQAKRTAEESQIAKQKPRAKKGYGGPRQAGDPKSSTVERLANVRPNVRAPNGVTQ